MKLSQNFTKTTGGFYYTFAARKAVRMLTEEEENFIKYWEKNRHRRRKLVYQLAVGLPVGLLFGLFIIINFYSGWYKRADMVANSRFNPVVLYVAVVIIAVFFAVFSKKFQYDQLQQRYTELLAKKNRKKEEVTDAASPTANESINEVNK
jgi:cation transporter-like permease